MRKSALIIFSGALAICGCQSRMPQAATLTSTAEVIAPAPSVPKALASYAGIWKGSWNHYLNTTLVVSSVTPPTAHIIYGWGTAPDWHIYTPGSTATTARFIGDRLIARLGNGAVVTYTPAPGGKLDATYVLAAKREMSSGVLTKQ